MTVTEVDTLNDVFRVISSDCAPKWRYLTKELRLYETDVSLIERRNKGRNEATLAYAAMVKWAERQGPEASVDKLVEVLLACRLKKAAETAKSMNVRQS